MTTCASCSSWSLRHQSPKLSRLGFGACARGSRHTFYAAASRCEKHQPAEAAVIRKRQSFLENMK